MYSKFLYIYFKNVVNTFLSNYIFCWHYNSTASPKRLYTSTSSNPTWIRPSLLCWVLSPQPWCSFALLPIWELPRSASLSLSKSRIQLLCKQLLRAPASYSCVVGVSHQLMSSLLEQTTLLGGQLTSRSRRPAQVHGNSRDSATRHDAGAALPPPTATYKCTIVIRLQYVK